MTTVMQAACRKIAALCIEPDPAVRRGLLAAARPRLRLRFEPRLAERLVERDWRRGIPPLELITIYLADTRLTTLARLATLRHHNPGLPVLLTVCYDGDYQLAAERLAELSERIVFRPFEAEALVTSMIDLGQKSGVS